MPSRYRVDANAFADFLKNSSYIHAELTRAGQEAVAIWKALAPVGNRTHITRGGYVDRPGSYRDSIRYKIMRNPTRMKVRVYTTDYKAHWLEFGTVKMAARHPMADAREELLRQAKYKRHGI
ncbi:hypothetical protein F5X71_34610 [Nocardia brasiliensis]|uniref:HK97 gp10 family phage protein n=1 Tax=Nocardia brasiliensis TaxID=37326 RepID=A0A6G9Y0M7_NOCBR|nr:HK97 gp10 family phage protein [Nocardia brasiliensis]QIS06759.1 hypothetical protein F5X71_34610 [Nocardia brasiliensis]